MNRFRYHITGIVQGIGFRPFVYRLAKKLNLAGFVQNTGEAVIIEIEGDKKEIDKFETILKTDLPPLAQIDEVIKTEIEPIYKKEFEILESNRETSKKTITAPPDIAICDSCIDDIYKQDRYINYFATNCTNCGPRYTIIQSIPYDRDNTSMKEFPLCKSCNEEFENPLNRRFHAQAIGCKNCGPQLTLIYDEKLVLDNIYQKVSQFIKQGKIGAVKAVGGFHIVCDATNREVVEKLRSFKNRPTKPFAVLCRDLDQIQTIANITEKEKEHLQSKESPIVLLNKKENSYLAPNIAPNIEKIGCFLPYNGFYLLLFDYLEIPIVATSANLGGGAIITKKEEVLEKLPFIDFIVDYNREIVNAIDDSVVQIIDSDISVLRLARGFAPKEIILDRKVDKKILCVGANSKSSISILFDNKIIISPYIGDLDNLDSYEFFKRTIKTFKEFYNFKPDIVVCDKHSGYVSTKFAKELAETEDIELVKVQHHLAHLYSVKAEYGLTGTNYIGFIFDGTGLGEDNRLWGGEVFVREKRKYYFKPIKLLGSEIAIKEPRRVALSLLFEKYSLDEVENLDLPTVKAFSKNEIRLLYLMWQKGINIVETSSAGRYFDAVASIAGIVQKISYEGESGIRSEAKAKKINPLDSFGYKIENGEIEIAFDFFDRDIVEKFYSTVIKVIIDIAKLEKLPVILSGGVFQNRVLLENVIYHLKKEKIEFFYNKQIPANDAGISVGQGWYVIEN